MKKDNTPGMDTCSNIRLSVIIPCYNAEQYIETCLNTIMQCNLSDIEVIVVNDGSTDRTADIIKEFSSSFSLVKVLDKKNGGVSSARNLGIEHAHGEWITFVDADDIPTMELLSFIPDGNADLYCFNWQYTTGEMENETLTDGIYTGVSKQKFLDQHLVDYIFRTPWAKIFRKEIVAKNNIKFDNRFRFGEDNLFILEYLKYVNSIITLKNNGYVYLRPKPSKYNMDIIDINDYMTVFVNLYMEIHANCLALIKLKLISFSLRIPPSQHNIWEMYSNIRKAENMVLRTFGKRELIRLFYHRILCFVKSPIRYVR